MSKSTAGETTPSPLSGGGAGVGEMTFVQVYGGVERHCTIGADVLAKALVDTSDKPAILFRIIAKNEKGNGPATQVRWLQANYNHQQQLQSSSSQAAATITTTQPSGTAVKRLR